MVGARPQASELPVKRMSETTNTFLRPKLSARLPARGKAIVTAMKKIEIVHADQRTLVCNSLVKFGKATATTVLSMAYIRILKLEVKKMR